TISGRSKDAWQNPDVPFRLSNAAVIGDAVYGLLDPEQWDSNFAFDVKTGKTLWTSEPRQGGNAALVKAGDIWFSLEDDGELVVARASRTSTPSTPCATPNSSPCRATASCSWLSQTPPSSNASRA
ncbi:MAG: hypothetical protein HC942_14785, partial [Microcoleus sp. SU_5_6]|nr:hypothetical protein [Microcoleus sp. SU_5_6]